MSVWAILAAAGSGERLGLDRPKAFASLNDRPLIAESLERLDSSDWIEGIVVAAPPEWEEPCILVAEEVAAGKVAATVTGGASRSESVRNALAEVPDEATIVLVHDAARPVVPEEVIERLITALGDGWDGAVPVLPIADTVKRLDGETVAETLDRKGLVTVQTPQAFLAPVLRDALAGRRRRCTRLRKPRRGAWRPDPSRRRRPAPAEGDDACRPRARRLLAMSDFRIGLGVDAHRFADGIPLVLAGVDFPGEPGLAGHSDGDVIAHALIDAILGAAGKGDIGELFPSSDPQWLDALVDPSSPAELRGREVAGFELVNADCVLIGERPKIAEVRVAMGARLAGAMGVDIDRVTVRATTTDGLGFTGRGEGLAAQAVALLRRSG